MTMDGGNHGHIEIVMRENLYLKISTTLYITPVDLGGIVTVPLQATTAKLSQLQDKHTESRHIHNNNHNMDLDLTTMVLDTVNNTYVFALHNFFIGSMG